jgi:hypothetical protein
MMHPPFDHLSKGPVSNQAMRGSHPHHCEQLAIFDGVINICPDAKSISAMPIRRMERLQSTAVPFLAPGGASNRSAASTPLSWGSLVVFHGQVGANPSPTKPSAPLTPRHLELD